MVAVYAGDSNAERYANGQDLVGDNGQTYSADAPQGKYPSVNQYVKNGLGDSFQGPTSQTVSAYDPTKYDVLKQVANEAVQESKVAWSVATKTRMDNFDNNVLQNHLTTVADIEDAAKSEGFTGEDLMNAIGKGKQVAGLLKLEQDQSAQDSYNAALTDIHNGNIINRSDLDAKYGASVPIEKLMSMENYLSATINKESKVPPEMQNADNMEAFRGVVKDAGLQGDLTEESRIRDKVTAEVMNMKSKGLAVTRSDIESITKQQSSAIILNKSLYTSDKSSVYVGDVPKGWSIDGSGPIDENGQRPNKYYQGNWFKTVNGVDYEMQP